MAKELRDYILSCVTIEMVYEQVIVPTNPRRFNMRGYSPRRTVICPFHDDNDPSLGMMKDKHKQGLYLYHCLGCGAVGDAIRMYQRACALYHNKPMEDEKEVMLDMAKFFSLDLTKAIYVEDSHPFASLMKARLSIIRAKDRYTIKDLNKDLLQIRRKRTSTPLYEVARGINSAIIKSMVTEKDLLY